MIRRTSGALGGNFKPTHNSSAIQNFATGSQLIGIAIAPVTLRYKVDNYHIMPVV